MKKWYTKAQFGNEICALDKLTQKQRSQGLVEIDAAKATKAAAVIVDLFSEGGKKNVLNNLGYRLKVVTVEANRSCKKRGIQYSLEEIERIEDIIWKMFYYQPLWWPFNRLRRNLKRLAN